MVGIMRRQDEEGSRIFEIGQTVRQKILDHFWWGKMVVCEMEILDTTYLTYNMIESRR